MENSTNNTVKIYTNDINIDTMLIGSADIESASGELVAAIRSIDELGRLVLPIEFRRALEVQEKDAMSIAISRKNGAIIIKKHVPEDIFTGETTGLIEFKGKYVSRATIEKLNELAGFNAAGQDHPAMLLPEKAGPDTVNTQH